MTPGKIRVQLIRVWLDWLEETKHFGGKSLAYIMQKQEEFRIRVASTRGLLDALDPKLLHQPSYILEIEYQNPDHHAGFNASEIVWGGSDPTPLIGGAFPSMDARLEWKQVAEPHDADYEGENLVGATGWALNPDFSGSDVPFTHPFGFDWEFMVALDQPADDPTKYSFLLARGNQAQTVEGASEAIQQAAEIGIPLPTGPDNLPSLLGVEIDRGVIPQGFSDLLMGGMLRGDRAAVFGRWIVDCGHEVEVSDVKSYRCEIHPPLLMASAYVTNASLASSSDLRRTRAQFASRAYLVGQQFTLNPDDATIDEGDNDGPFVTHLLKEVVKVDSFLSNGVEAHPKIKARPFSGQYEAHFIIRPPAPTNPFVNPGRLNVSYQFTVRSNCNVSVTAADATGVRVVVTLDANEYIPLPLPPRNEKAWTRSDLDDLRPGTGTTYLGMEIINAVLGGGLRALAIMEFDGIQTDVYDPVDGSVDLNDSHSAVSVFLEDLPNLPVNAGVNHNDGQHFPVFGWLEIGYQPLTKKT